MGASLRLLSVTSADGTNIAATVKGSGPLVVLVHGFPESWYSWRNQFDALAEAGYTAAAIHVRGYGRSDKPADISAYTSRRNAEDIVAVIDGLGFEDAVLIGHDWGSVLVQNTVYLFPEKVRAVVTLSVPIFAAATKKMSEAVGGIYPDNFFYQLYFQEPGVAEAEIAENPERFLRLFYHYLSAEHPADHGILIRPKESRGLLDGLPEPEVYPDWLGANDLEVYAGEFRDGGFGGPLNRYRAADLDFEDLKGTEDKRITQPIMFVGGAEDPSRYIYGVDSYADPLMRSDDPRGATVIDGVGHWIQQEAPDEVNRRILAFLEEVA